MTEALPLRLHRWDRPADDSDRAVLAHCQGPTLDIGCGPGRMAAHLAEQGRTVLGVDLVGEAVSQALGRGATALHRDVFGPLPGEGRWQTALLADGNIGIGGDPAALLRRAAAVIAPGGRVVADLSPPGSGISTGLVTIETASGATAPVPWAWVGVEAVDAVAEAAELVARAVHEHEGRWFVVLGREP